ncbi:MAG: right-handed parallel beta-helix repeat-containing protein [Actinomycetota bacterium]
MPAYRVRVLFGVALVVFLTFVPGLDKGEALATGEVNIKKAYGARCDGESIDTEAFLKAAASGKNIYIPPGTCRVGKEVTLKPGAHWRGAGQNRTSVRNYFPFRLTSNTSVSSLRVFNVPDSDNPTGTAFATDDSTARSGAVVRNVRIEGFWRGIYVGRPADGTTHHRMNFSGNRFYNTRLAINAVKLNDSRIVRNTFIRQNAAIEFWGGSRNLISRNKIDGRGGAGGDSPRVGILFLPKDEELGGYGEVRGNRITYNTVRNFTEEGISFDTRAAEPWNTNIREVDGVAAVYETGGEVYVKLASGEWSIAPPGRYDGYLMTALTGSERGRHFRIFRHSGATFRMGPAASEGRPNPARRLEPGDQVAIGSPFINNVIMFNTVDASKAFAGINLHGYSYGARILRNDVTAPPKAAPEYQSLGYPNPVGIRVTSLLGVAEGRGSARREDGSCNTINDRNCDGDSLNDPGDAYVHNDHQRKAPSENNEVYGNTVRGGDVAFNLFNYTRNPDHAFTSYGNKAAANSFVDGLKLRLDHHKLAPPDATAPNTRLGFVPSQRSGKTVRFFFRSSEEGSVFACSLDGAAFRRCASPKQYSKLGRGKHTFRVRATDAAGNTDPTPAVYTWRVRIP